MSLIRILTRPTQGKNLIFIGSESRQLDNLWYSLNKEGSSSSNLGLSEVNLYNALRGYLDEKGVKYKQQGATSNDLLLRLEEEKDVTLLNQFVAMVRRYDAIESRVHSEKDDEELVAFKEKLVRYASKYKK